jgi:hypothetical protein
LRLPLFADLNAKLLAASKGRRSLDDLVLAMLTSKRAGGAYDEARWRALLHADLGQSGIDDLDRMLAGTLIVPASNAFGPCLERTQRTLRGWCWAVTRIRCWLRRILLAG